MDLAASVERCGVHSRFELDTSRFEGRVYFNNMIFTMNVYCAVALVWSFITNLQIEAGTIVNILNRAFIMLGDTIFPTA